MNGSLANDVHRRIDLRNGNNGMEEEIPESKLGISFSWTPFYSKLYMVVYTFSPSKNRKTMLNKTWANALK